MRIERAFLRVTLLTQFTNKRSLAGMLSHMIIQIALCPSSIITCCTFEWFLPGMNAHMNLYALFLGEAFSAYLTVVGPFARVRPLFRTKLNHTKAYFELLPHMQFQCRLFSEVLITDVTLVLACSFVLFIHDHI